MRVKKLTLCGVMTAVVFVMTYFPKVPVPVTGGYIHLGDGAIFLAAMLLGSLSVPAAAVGSALADLVGGYSVYVLPTLLIKGAMAFVAWKFCRPGKPARQLAAFSAAELLMVAGYFVLELFLAGIPAAAAALLPNLVQGASGAVLGMLFAALLPRLEKAVR